MSELLVTAGGYSGGGWHQRTPAVSIEQSGGRDAHASLVPPLAGCLAGSAPKAVRISTPFHPVPHYYSPPATLEAASDASGQRTLVATLLPQGGTGAGAPEELAIQPDPTRVAAMLAQAKVGCKRHRSCSPFMSVFVWAGSMRSEA